MQPTNEQVVAACQRAEIDVFSVGSLLFIGEYEISANLDYCPGSALFIVAVLGAMKERLHHVGHFDDYWYVTWVQRPIDSVTQEAKGATLTAACMTAIVAAYPEEARKG